MAEAIDLETRLWAAALWCEEGLTYEAVSARTGVSVGALKKWADDEGWADKRREHRQALRDIRSNTIKLRTALITKALGSLNAQDVYAVTSLEAVIARSAGKTETGRDNPAPTPDNLREIKTPQQAIEAMQGAIEQRVNAMLSGGDISLPAIKELKASLDMLEKMRGDANKVELFMEFMRVLIEYLGKHDQEALAAIEGNFDEFMAFIRDKYKVA